MPLNVNEQIQILCYYLLEKDLATCFNVIFVFFRCHLPVLYIGLEYGLTNNTKLAERFFTQALSIAPDDPFVLHEMGVISFQNAEYVQQLFLIYKKVKKKLIIKIVF